MTDVFGHRLWFLRCLTLICKTPPGQVAWVAKAGLGELQGAGVVKLFGLDPGHLNEWLRLSARESCACGMDRGVATSRFQLTLILNSQRPQEGMPPWLHVRPLGCQRAGKGKGGGMQMYGNQGGAAPGHSKALVV